MASITSHNPADTFAAGCTLAPTLRIGDVLALCGDLGAGKTQFVKGLAEGLEIKSEVTSPTFTLIHEYGGGLLPLFHIDLYRLETPGEALQLGLDEYLSPSGVTVIEWADKFPELLPEAARWIRFTIGEGDDREIAIG